MTTITTLPVAPSRTDPTTFSARGDALLGALAQFVTETNTVAGEVNTNAALATTQAGIAATQAGLATTNGATQVALATTQANLATTNGAAQVTLATTARTAAETAASLAASSANYKGLWSSLTGALNMPASVSHNGAFWALNTNLANVTTATPGVSASWTAIANLGGATTTSSAVDITLTASSTRVQVVTMTAASKSVYMADATTLQKGGELTVIKNAGTLSLYVRDASGNLLTMVRPGGCVATYLTDNTSSSGTWVIGNQSVVSAIYPGLVTTVNAAGTITSITVVPLSTTQAIVMYQVGSLKARTLNISGTTITMGAELTLEASAAAPCYSAAMMSSTQAVATYTIGSVLKAVTLNVSGTTITAGTVLLPTTSSTVTGANVTALSSTVALVAYYQSTPQTVHAMTLTVSGTSLTNGAESVGVSMSGGAAPLPQVATLSSTLALIALTSSAGCKAATVTISGTTATINAVLTVTTLSNGLNVGLTALSATQAVVSFSYSSPIAVTAALLAISGTTVTLTSTTQITGDNSNYLSYGYALAKISSTQCAMLQQAGVAGNSMRALLLTVNGSTLVESAKTDISGPIVAGLAMNSPQLWLLSPSQLIAVYGGVSGYPVANILEVTS